MCLMYRRCDSNIEERYNMIIKFNISFKSEIT